MPDVRYPVLRYEQAAGLLPEGLRSLAMAVPEVKKAGAEEFRLRVGRMMSVVFPDGERFLPPDTRTGGSEKMPAVGPDDLAHVLDRATQSSVHTAIESIRTGFVTVRGGHRVGICGTAVVKDREITNIRKPSSVSIRISKEAIGAADGVIDGLFYSGAFCNTLIISPPGCGKTTLLRDVVRQISNGIPRLGIPNGVRVAVADERSEIAASYDGAAQLDVGAHTDVLDACPKAAGMLILLRAMNPQVLAVDEITAPEDIKALETASNCGVSIIATAHGNGVDDLESRPLYRRLLAAGIFQKAVTISRRDNLRRYTITDLR